MREPETEIPGTNQACPGAAPRPRSAMLAVFLSFFYCGLGQLYNGRVLKGVGLLVIYQISVWFGVMFLSSTAAMTAVKPAESAGAIGIFGGVSLLVAGAMWLYGMVDAYRTVPAQP